MTAHDPSRRDAMKHGLAALGALGAIGSLGATELLARAARAAPLLAPPVPPPPPPVDPVLALGSLGPSKIVGGIPFAPQWFGDVFGANAIPFHSCENCSAFPEPSERVEVAVIGGGLSGLATAYLLRDRETVLFELRPRLGGGAMGESFAGRSWSLASAYFMQADGGSKLAALYGELGLPSTWRQDAGDFSFEYDGELTRDLLGPNPTQEEVAALAAYRATVAAFANDTYPEIPFDGRPSDLVRELDARSFREDLALRCGKLPRRLSYLLEAYCASSLGVGSDEINAAAAWNFVAAEEFGRNVLPAGNAGLARALWRHAPRVDFRCRATVAEVAPVEGGALVRWRDGSGAPRTTFAKQVVLANAKHIARHMMPWLDGQDPAKREAMQQVPTVAYVVANMVLREPLGHDFYDLYLQGSSKFPTETGGWEERRPITDMVNAGFATQGGGARALTLYWPLPWHTARFSIVGADDWRNQAERAAPQIAEICSAIGLTPSNIAQVRLARWGHAMPYATPGAYGGGLPQELRRPLLGKIWFVNQDNWLLPAVETCLSEAMWAAPQIRSALG